MLYDVLHLSIKIFIQQNSGHFIMSSKSIPFFFRMRRMWSWSSEQPFTDDSKHVSFMLNIYSLITINRSNFNRKIIWPKRSIHIKWDLCLVEMYIHMHIHCLLFFFYCQIDEYLFDSMNFKDIESIISLHLFN